MSMFYNYDTLDAEIEKLETELTLLKSQNAKLIECVKFYADEENWTWVNVENGFTTNLEATQLLKDIGEV